MPLSPTYCRDLASQFAPCEDREILGLFAERLRHGILADLARDGALDLGMSESLDADALVAPLGSKRFPTDTLRERNWVLSEMVGGYAASDLPTDAVARDKQLFILACFLHVNSADAGLPDLPVELVTAMVVERASVLPCDARLMVARFLLGIAIRYEPYANRMSTDPRPLLLTTIECLLATFFVDMSTFSHEPASEGLFRWAISKPGVQRWQQISRRLLGLEGAVLAASSDLAELIEATADHP